MSIRTRFNPLGTIGRKGLLPAGYIELEYLESTGTQWIDTGLLCNYSYIIDLDIVTLKAKGIGFQSFFGYAATSTQNYKLSAYVGQNNNFAAYIGNNAAVTTPNDVATPGSKHSIRITEKCLYVDNILYSDSAPVLQAGNGNMYLFARNGNFNSGQFRIYTFKVKLNNKLVRNFIPALDPTGRPCMFDTVTRQPFYNQGTGEFLWRLKKDTLPSGYRHMREVSIPSHFVTDIKATQTNTVRCVFYMENKVLAGFTSLFRAYTGDNAPSQRVIQYRTNNELALIYNRAANDYNNAPRIYNVDFTKWHDITLAMDKTVFDGVVYNTNPGNLTVNAYWGANGQGQQYWNDSLKWRLFEITDNGVLTHRLIPVMSSDNRAALYDVVAGKTYYTPTA